MGGLAHFVVSSSPMIYFAREICSKLRVRERERGEAVLPVVLLKILTETQGTSDFFLHFPYMLSVRSLTGSVTEGNIIQPSHSDHTVNDFVLELGSICFSCGKYSFYF